MYEMMYVFEGRSGLRSLAQTKLAGDRLAGSQPPAGLDAGCFGMSDLAFAASSGGRVELLPRNTAGWQTRVSAGGEEPGFPGLPAGPTCFVRILAPPLGGYSRSPFGPSRASPLETTALAHLSTGFTALRQEENDCCRPIPARRQSRNSCGSNTRGVAVRRGQSVLGRLAARQDPTIETGYQQAT